MGIRGLKIMKFNQYIVECTYNGKISMSFKVTAANPRMAMETAKSIVGHHYELRVRL